MGGDSLAATHGGAAPQSECATPSLRKGLSRLSMAVTRTIAQSNLGWGLGVSQQTVHSPSLTKGSQCRSLEAGTEAEGQGGTLLTGLLGPGMTLHTVV